MNASGTNGGKWYEVGGASRRVGQLVEESGALLETQVSETCQRFVGEHEKKQGVRLSTDILTYGKATASSALREIDQHVSLYKEFILDGRTGVQLQADILIESKFRKDVEVFGVPYPRNAYRPRLPVVGFAKGSQLAGSVEGVAALGSLALVRLVFIEIKDGVTPRNICDEALAYNSASAIYDFIRFELSEYAAEFIDSYSAQIIIRMGLLRRFETYLKEKHYAWWSVLLEWMRENISDRQADEFNKRLGVGRCFYPVHGFFPILCVNGRAWTRVADTFGEETALLTRVRVRGWPGRFRPVLLRYSIEAPLIIASVSGLTHVLEDSLAWFLSLEKALKAAERKTVWRWHIESAFYRLVVSKQIAAGSERNMRSDLDVFDWI